MEVALLHCSIAPFKYSAFTIAMISGMGNYGPCVVAPAEKWKAGGGGGAPGAGRGATEGLVKLAPVLRMVISMKFFN